MPRIHRVDSIWRDLRKEIGAKVRWARQERGFTLEHVAQSVGFTDYKPVHQIEKGLMGIPPDRIARLEALLGFEPFELFTLEASCRLECQGFDVRGWLQALAERTPPLFSEHMDGNPPDDRPEIPNQQPNEISIVGL